MRKILLFGFMILLISSVFAGIGMLDKITVINVESFNRMNLEDINFNKSNERIFTEDSFVIFTVKQDSLEKVLDVDGNISGFELKSKDINYSYNIKRYFNCRDNIKPYVYRDENGDFYTSNSEVDCYKMMEENIAERILYDSEKEKNELKRLQEETRTIEENYKLEVISNIISNGLINSERIN